MVWQLLISACGLLTALLMLKKAEHSKVVFAVLAGLFLFQGVFSVLKERSDEKTAHLKEEKVEKDRQRLLAEIAALKKMVEPGPKAKLQFGFEKEPPPWNLTDEEWQKRLLKSIAVPSRKGKVQVRLVVQNFSGVDAIEPQIHFQLPEGFRFLAERPPVRLQPPARDSPPNFRYFKGYDWPHRTPISAFVVDIGVPPGAKSFPVGFHYSCRTCVREEMQRAEVIILRREGSHPRRS